MNKQKTTYKYILKYSDFASHKAYIGRAFSTCGKIGNVMLCTVLTMMVVVVW